MHLPHREIICQVRALPHQRRVEANSSAALAWLPRAELGMGASWSGTDTDRVAVSTTSNSHYAEDVLGTDGIAGNAVPQNMTMGAPAPSDSRRAVASGFERNVDLGTVSDGGKKLSGCSTDRP